MAIGQKYRNRVEVNAGYGEKFSNVLYACILLTVFSYKIIIHVFIASQHIEALTHVYTASGITISSIN